MGAYLSLSALSELTALRVLAPHQRRGGGGGAVDATPPLPGPIDPQPLHDADADAGGAVAEGEPVEDDWVPIELNAAAGHPHHQLAQAGAGAFGLLRSEGGAGPSLLPPLNEPHLKFASLLPGLQVLVRHAVCCLCARMLLFALFSRQTMDRNNDQKPTDLLN